MAISDSQTTIIHFILGINLWQEQTSIVKNIAATIGGMIVLNCIIFLLGVMITILDINSSFIPKMILFTYQFQVFNQEGENDYNL